jgi:hypothetical protein
VAVVLLASLNLPMSASAIRGEPDVRADDIISKARGGPRLPPHRCASVRMRAFRRIKPHPPNKSLT